MHNPPSLRIALAILLVVSFTAVAMPSKRGIAQVGDSGEPVVARVTFSNASELALLAARLDIWEVQHEEGYLVAMVTVRDQEWLQETGLSWEADATRTALLTKRPAILPDQTSGIPGYPCYRTVEETHTDMLSLAYNPSNLVRWVDIGDSWEKTQPGGLNGYDIYALVLTNQSIASPKPKFFLMGAMHARELVTAEMAARFAEHLVSQYGVDPDVTMLLDYYETHIVPMSNPDGRKKAEEGYSWRKNTDNDDGCFSPLYWGTDLNRNSSFLWGGTGASPYPCDITYRGPSPASEPETAAIEAYVRSIFPDQRGPGDFDPAPPDAMGAFITLHSFGSLVLWPWGHTYTPAPNDRELQTFGRKMAYFNNYEPKQSVELYPTNGTTDDFAYGDLGIAAYTFEMGDYFFQDCSTFENTIYPNNLQALLYAAKASRRPYQNPSGPDSLNTSIFPNKLLYGEPAVLSAVGDDTRYYSVKDIEPTQVVAAGRFSIDSPPWVEGAALYPMFAADGAFDSKVETVLGDVNTSMLPLGRHTLYVETMDSDGNWGVPSAVFLQVDGTPSYGAALTVNNTEPVVLPGTTISLTLSLTNTGNVIDEYLVSGDGGDWDISTPAQAGPFPPTGEIELPIGITPPVTATLGTEHILGFTAVSQSDPVASSTITVTAHVPDPLPFHVELLDREQSGIVGETLTYTLRIENYAAVTDTFTVTNSTGEWATTSQPTISVGPGEVVDTPILLKIPYTARHGEVALVSVMVTPASEPSIQVIFFLQAEAQWRRVFLTDFRKDS